MHLFKIIMLTYIHIVLESLGFLGERCLYIGLHEGCVSQIIK